MSKPKAERGIIILRFKRPDFQLLMEHVCCVNRQPAKIGGRFYPPETLLLLPPTAEVRVDRRGFRVWRVIGRLWIRRRGWNTFERGETGQFAELINAQTGERLCPYQPIDFKELMQGAKVLT